MDDLDAEIEQLERLDRQRIVSAEMRDQGRKALRDHLDVSEDWAQSSTKHDPLVVKALCDRKEGPPLQLVKDLECIQEGEKPVSLPVLHAARTMQALAAAPDSAFSESFLYSYYLVVREIYTADAPDWKVGGARAAIGGMASAFVTGECVRAILTFVRTLENTRGFLNEVAELLERKKQLEDQGISSKWCVVERDRMNWDFCSTVMVLLDNIALKLEKTGDEDQQALKPTQVAEFIDKAPGRISNAVADTVEGFSTVIRRAESLRLWERDEREKEEAIARATAKTAQTLFRAGSRQRRYERSETGHVVALGALDQGKAWAELAHKLLVAGNDATAIKKLAVMFKSVAQDVRGLLHPALSYLSTVLDRELAAASSEARSGWDPAEMIFAAVSYGYAKGFEDDRLRRAGIYLSEELSDLGRFRAGRPFHVDDGGNFSSVSETNVLQAFAQLLEHVERIPVDDDLTRRMLFFLNNIRRRFRSKGNESESRDYGWCLEEALEPAKPEFRTTAQSVLALDRINRMLDARINARVFRHFSVKHPADLKIPVLRSLVFPDFGLRFSPDGSREKSHWQEEPVARVLEKMRAHVLGLSGRGRSGAPLFSLILYGPPGTGKTTLVEALAKSANVPLVEISPSDIVSSGADIVERRARAVFKALSLLTRVVILFDEFDPVLKRRARANEMESNQQPTVFSFVTPGMLPKLKHLHDQADRRSFCYVLVTNLVGVLEGAAIRPGRFDCKLGIYAPDPVSRMGRLQNEALKVQSLIEWPEAFPDRIRHVVQGTGGATIQSLARRGWLLAPKEPKDWDYSPFGYLKKGEGFPTEISEVKAEAKVWDEGSAELMDAESKKAAYREYEQGRWIREWEGSIAKAGSLGELEEVPERPKSDASRSDDKS